MVCALGEMACSQDVKPSASAQAMFPEIALLVDVKPVYVAVAGTSCTILNALLATFNWLLGFCPPFTPTNEVFRV